MIPHQADFGYRTLNLWEEWFAWHPVRVHGHWLWLQPVLRRPYKRWQQQPCGCWQLKPKAFGWEHKPR